MFSNGHKSQLSDLNLCSKTSWCRIIVNSWYRIVRWKQSYNFCIIQLSTIADWNIKFITHLLAHMERQLPMDKCQHGWVAARLPITAYLITLQTVINTNTDNTICTITIQTEVFNVILSNTLWVYLFLCCTTKTFFFVLKSTV